MRKPLAGHDDLLIQDVARVGISEEALNEELPSGSIAAMVGMQYYFIDHFPSAVHLGYIGLLEGCPPKLSDVGPLVELARAGSDVWNTYRLHAELDEDHGKHLVR